MRPRSRPIELRPHHVLCIGTFAGSGYTQAFVSNMKRIVAAYQDPSQLVRVVEGPDDICAACPHSDGLACTKDGADAPALDKRVLKALELTVGETYLASSLRHIAGAAAKDGRLLDACAGCEWLASHCSK